MKPQQVASHIKALNDSDRDTLPVVWEVAVLNALRRTRDFDHEPKTGARTPDIWIPETIDQEGLVVDIKTVSDEGLHERNPIERLEEEFRNRFSRLRLTDLRGGFQLKIKQHSKPPTGRARHPTRLKIPPVGAFAKVIFNAEFDRFASRLAEAPHHNHVFRVNTKDCDIELSFNPAGWGWSTNYPVYNSAPTLKNNTVWNGLKEKADQLKEVPLRGIRGIILCDGDCYLMQRLRGDSNSFGLEDVIKDFLRQRKSIGFVLVLVPMYGPQATNLNPQHLSIDSHLYHRYPPDSLPKAIAPFLDVARLLPHPMSNATNARHHLNWLKSQACWHVAPTFIGGMQMSGNKIRISARAVLELLAGSLSQAEFEKAHGFSDSKRNPFLRKLKSGQLIKSIRIEPDDVPERDDDWIVIELADDPAVSPFVATQSPSIGD